MYGWKHKILRVDLDRGVCVEESLDPKVAREYIRGRGLGIYFLNKELDPKCDSLSPDNILVMATGPLTGTKAATGGRYMVMTKSPLSGAITTSNSGGMFPTEMKRAGYDAIIFSGRAKHPVYLWLDNGRAELRPANHLWGKTVEEPGYEGKGEGSEYETLYAMGSNCMIDHLPAIIKANYLCNEPGMDTISMGCTIACAMELVERGYLAEDEIGQRLAWGDGDTLIALTRKTAYREGFGDVLAQGSYRLAERYGHPELAIVSKKQDFAGYEPRRLQAMGLAFATSPLGASHMRGDTGCWELPGGLSKVDARMREGKGRLVKIWQDLFTIIDASGWCVFFAVRYLVNKTEVAEPVGILDYLNTITDADYTMDELLQAGERIFNVERKFMADAGFSRKDDALPRRTIEEPLPEGPVQGSVCHLDEMLDDYYSYRGWTTDGIPKYETLKRLSLN